MSTDKKITILKNKDAQLLKEKVKIVIDGIEINLWQHHTYHSVSSYEGWNKVKSFTDLNSKTSGENGDLVFTGIFQIPRKEALEYAIKLGFKVHSNVSKNTNFVIIGSENVSPSKISKALRLNKEKNTKDLIYAFKKANIAHSKLDIIGNGPLLESLKLLCKDLDIVDHVIFHGNQTNIGQLLNNADVFVFSSLNEGFPNVILEAMYYELPIISYKFKAGITTILGNGKFGILVPLNDIDKFVKQMKLLAFDKKERIYYQKLSKQRVFCFMNVKQYINKYVSLINLEDGE